MATIGTDADDSLVGSGADESIDGGNGNDEIAGRGGDDTLLGGNDNDSIFGGTGNDALFGELGADQLFGSAGDDELRGGNEVDELSGGSGNDVLDGNRGADRMDGGAGNDRYFVDNREDQINEEAGALKGGIDSITSSVTFRMPDNVERMTLVGAERINGAGNDIQNRIIGNEARNILGGGNAIDLLSGGGGADYLDGGNDNDTMVGGVDSDTYIVDETADAIVEEALGGLADRVLARADFTLPDNVEELTLRGRVAIGLGNAGANTITGNASDNSLRGGRGNDTLLAANGNDWVQGGDDNDELQCGLGSDTAYGGDGVDTLGGDVGRDVPGGSADTLFGGADTDTLYGDQGDDSIAGDDDLDHLFGGDGNDRLFGGDGTDTLNGGMGSDILDGGKGRDLAMFAEGGTAPVRVELARGLAATGSGRDTLRSIEDAGGGLGNDRLIGDGNTNRLYGFDGDDILIGGVAGVTGNTQVRGDGTLVGGLGGARGFGENALPLGDDSPFQQVDLTSVFGSDGISFFGREFTSLFVNNNGNVTFNSAQSAFTPFVITGATSNPIIAPFFADVDTARPAENSGEPQPAPGTDMVYWDLDPTNKAFTATWDQVGFFNDHTSKTNSFQLQLFDRGGAGDFDIVFRYASINWTTGDANNDVDGSGLGGIVARAGYSSGNGFDFQELPAAGNQAQVLALDTAAGNTGKKGLWVFEVRNGIVEGDLDQLSGGNGNDVLVGGLGKDRLNGGAGNDRFDYANRNEGGDSISEFDPSVDVIDLSRVLSGFVAGSSDPAQFLKLVPIEEVEDGEIFIDTMLQVDFDGGADNFVDFVTLIDKTGLTVSGLVGGGAIDLIA